MKRALILILLFLLIIGGVFLALTLSSGGSSKKIVLEDASSADEIEQIIIHEWSIATEWDKNLYSDLKDQIQMSKNADLISTSQEEQLTNLNGARASLVIVPIAQKEFKKSDCRRAVIAKCSDGISTIKKDGFTNQETLLVGKCCAVYFQIHNLIDSETKCETDFKVSNGSISWNDFSKFIDEQQEKVNSLKNDVTYTTYLGGIDDLRNGLNSRMDAVKANAESYYSAVCDEFVEYFAEHRDLDKSDLVSAQNKFVNEVSRYSGSEISSIKSRLSNCVSNY